MSKTIRAMALAGLLAAGGLLLSGASTAQAQWGYGGSRIMIGRPGGFSGNIGRGFPGYAPGVVTYSRGFTGYTAPAWGGFAPAPAWGGFAPAYTVTSYRVAPGVFYRRYSFAPRRFGRPFGFAPRRFGRRW